MSDPLKVQVDALEALPGHLTIEVSVKLRNLWRVRLGVALVGLGARILRTRAQFVPPGPPLILTSTRFLSREEFKHLRESFDAAFRGDRQPRIKVIEPGLTVWQLIRGEWIPLEAPRTHDADD